MKHQEVSQLKELMNGQYFQVADMMKQRINHSDTPSIFTTKNHPKFADSELQHHSVKHYATQNKKQNKKANQLPQTKEHEKLF